MVLRFSGSCWSPWHESSGCETDLVMKIIWMQPWFIRRSVEEAGLQVHPLLETPQRSSAGGTAEGNEACCFHCRFCHHLLLKEKKCSFLSASNSDLPLAETWSVPFLAPKQSQAIKFGSTRADRGWMVIAFLYLLAAYLVQQAIQENFLINRALSWQHMYTASGHYKSVVIALWLGKSPGAAVLLGKQSWRKAEKETGLHSKGCLLS